MQMEKIFDNENYGDVFVHYVTAGAVWVDILVRHSLLHDT